MAANNAVRLKRELAQVPITAVAFYREPVTGVLYVLAGEDTDLVIYRAASSSGDAVEEEKHIAVARIRMLNAQPIHGIHVHNQPEDGASAGRVLLWGGSSVAIFKASDLNLHVYSGAGGGGNSKNMAQPLPRIARLRAPDWIYDGAVSTSDANLAVLVTAHNEVITVRYDETAGTAALSSGLVSPSRPMLYAANVRWTSPTKVLVAAGTVFGDILVWKYAFGEKEGEGEEDEDEEGATRSKPQTLFSLSGHEGSIFGVHMSPLMEMPDGMVRLLASCSDDRTIRIWNITESEAGGNTMKDDASTLPETSDTGFRCAPAVYGEEKDGGDNGRSDMSPVATAMGHASRIWGVRFGVPNTHAALTSDDRQRWGGGGAGAGGKGLLSLYSFGEDATVQKWSLDIAAALQQPHLSKLLLHEKTYALHNGKHLWSGDALCCMESGVATTYVLSGGSDSKITLIKETTNVQGSSSSSTDVYNNAETWDMHDIIPPPLDSVPAMAKLRKELISRYDFLTPDVILAVSNLGKVCLGTFVGKDATWRELIVEDEAVAEDMKNVYSLKTVSHGGALLGSTTGGVYYFGLEYGRIEKVASLAGRVVEMNALSKTFPGATGDAEAIIHLHRDATSVYLTLDRATGKVKSQEEITGLDGRFVAISAARIDNDVLAMGSRHGWISLLRRDTTTTTGTFRPILDLPPLSGDSITAIVPLPPSPNANLQSRTKYVLTTSRDGKYRIFGLHIDEDADTTIRMELLHETAPPFGPWIEGAWFTGDAAAPELILYGFRSKDFVVWNETRREELATMDCGGAHRTFRLVCDEQAPAVDAGSVRFAFTRTSKLSVHSQRGTSYERMRLGAHGREIRSLSAKGGRYVATGAEDATIRLWEYNNGDGVEEGQRRTGGHGKLKYMAYLKRHVAGLQKVQWLGDEYLFSSGGNEELFAWRVRPLDSAYAGSIAVMCEGVFMDKSPVEDLRIMDFDVSTSPDAEGTTTMLVTLAFSNSELKTYRYSAKRGFELVCKGMYTGACLTQARHLEIQDGVDLQVVTASTDGHIALWRGSSGAGNNSSNSKEQQQHGTYELRQTLRVHQSSIKSLDMTRLAGGGGRRGYGVLTGGDDNALAFTLLKQAAAAAEGKDGAEDDDSATDLGFSAELGAVVRRAHAAAMTGIAILGSNSSRSEGGDVRCVSVSNDQWVKTWRIREDDTGSCKGIELLGEGYSGVADPGDVVVLDEEEEEEGEKKMGEGGEDGEDGEEGSRRSRRRVGNFRVMVAGVGLEVWRVGVV